MLGQPWRGVLFNLIMSCLSVSKLMLGVQVVVIRNHESIAFGTLNNA